MARSIRPHTGTSWCNRPDTSLPAYPCLARRAEPGRAARTVTGWSRSNPVAGNANATRGELARAGAILERDVHEDSP
jgi:hypothetical protein